MENIIVSVTYQNKNLSCSVKIEHVDNMQQIGVSALGLTADKLLYELKENLKKENKYAK